MCQFDFALDEILCKLKVRLGLAAIYQANCLDKMSNIGLSILVSMYVCVFDSITY